MTERMVMRRVREGEVPPDGAHRAPGRPRPPVFRGQRPVRLRLRRVRQRARASMGLEAMTKRVRIKCGRCKTVNVAVFDAKGET